MNRNALTKIKKDNAFNEKQINKKLFYKSSQNPQYAQKIPSGYSISQKIGDPQSTVKYWKFQWPLFNFIPRDPYPQFPLIYDEKNAWFLLFFVKIFMIIFLFFTRNTMSDHQTGLSILFLDQIFPPFLFWS